VSMQVKLRPCWLEVFEPSGCAESSLALDPAWRRGPCPCRPWPGSVAQTHGTTIRLGQPAQRVRRSPPPNRRLLASPPTLPASAPALAAPAARAVPARSRRNRQLNAHARRSPDHGPARAGVRHRGPCTGRAASAQEIRLARPGPDPSRGAPQRGPLPAVTRPRAASSLIRAPGPGPGRTGFLPESFARGRRGCHGAENAALRAQYSAIAGRRQSFRGNYVLEIDRFQDQIPGYSAG
jgi:hypothetical protein